MSDQTVKNKVMKSWRLHPDIVDAIKRGTTKHDYPDETSFVEALFRRALGLPEPPLPKPPQVGKGALQLRA
jgi:hypothetical protein